ncbi:hypothetical protein B0H19DRAFT_1063026 [Mycena capillaripes]|nr:hypothetical protein B0H19DRAFT_1063026 [Mycena capillaripes]
MIVVLSQIGPLKLQGTEARSIEICSMRWLAYMRGFPDGDELNDTSRAMPTRWASRDLVQENMSDGLEGKGHSIPDARRVALGNTRIDGNSCVDLDNAERQVELAAMRKLFETSDVRNVNTAAGCGKNRAGREMCPKLNSQRTPGFARHLRMLTRKRVDRGGSEKEIYLMCDMITSIVNVESKKLRHMNTERT